MNILVINGPNLNMLGTREPAIYGYDTLDDINKYIAASFPSVKFDFFQSNHEGAIIDLIQTTQADGVLINAGAYTHYSIAIHDAIASRDSVPFVEIHLSDPKKREKFRSVSYLESVCKATFAGFGKDSYIKGVAYLLDKEEK